MINRYTTLFLMLTINIMTYSQSNQYQKEIDFIQSFFESMKNWDNLDEYVTNSDNRTINFYYVKTYKIVSINHNSAIVEINNRNRLFIELINIDKKIFIKGYISKTDSRFINPWYKAEKIKQ